MQLIDTHCHLQFDKLAQRAEAIIDDAKSAGVGRLICVGTTVDDSQQAIEYAASYNNIWAAVGHHPHDAKDFDLKNAPTKIKALLKQPKIVAIGETGLDFFKNYSPPLEQEKLLRLLIEVGLTTSLPFIFHVREAFDDFWRIYDSYPKMRGVVHSFSASEKELDQILSRGLYVGLNGIMTFTKDERQLAAARKVPLDKLLLETDSPFLAPAGARGQTCEPKHLAMTAEFLAELRGESLADLAEQTTKNAEELFGLK